MTSTAGVLVSDFDGTMTRHDFYKLAVGELLPEGVPDYWAEYRAGERTHFEALQAYFAEIRAGDDEVDALIGRMELDSQLPDALKSLRQAGWRVVVTSAGCEWYIRRLLRPLGEDIEVHANPGQFVAGRGLLMEMNRESPYWSPTLGVDKVAVVRHYLKSGRVVAFAGDGFPDVDPARLVRDDLRFARGDLAAVLRAEGRPYHAFDTWSEIASHLLGGRG
ncbi:MAG: HAD-IB family phosphatase [Pirellulaceae bacterium]